MTLSPSPQPPAPDREMLSRALIAAGYDNGSPYIHAAMDEVVDVILAALPLALTAPATPADKWCLDWFEANTNVDLSHTWIDDEESVWQVHRIDGGRNDREWTLIGSGSTPRAAILAAAPQPPEQRTAPDNRCQRCGGWLPCSCPSPQRPPADDDVGRELIATLRTPGRDTSRQWADSLTAADWIESRIAQSETRAGAVVPEGWQLVPVVPDAAMADAGVSARWRSPVRDANNVREIYQAMLSAAPQPPAREIERLREALVQIVDEKCDYMRINNLGDPETQHTVKTARAALSQTTRSEDEA